MWSEPSGSSTSACRTVTASPRRPRTRSRTQPEMFWPPSSVHRPSPRGDRSTGNAATTRTGGAVRGSMTPTSNGTIATLAQPAVVEARPVPAGRRSRRSIVRPVVEVGGRISPVDARQSSSVATTTRLPSAQLDLELGDQAELVAVVAPLVPGLPAEPASIPAVAEDRRRSRSRPGVRSAVTSYVSARSRWRYGVQPGASRSAETGRPLILTWCSPSAVTWRRARVTAPQVELSAQEGAGACRDCPGRPAA